MREFWAVEPGFDIPLQIRPPSVSEAEALENRTLISLVYPRQNEALVDKLAQQKATVLSLDSLLRTLSRGQAFDVLSSQVNLRESQALRQPKHARFFLDARLQTSGDTNLVEHVLLGAYRRTSLDIVL